MQETREDKNQMIVLINATALSIQITDNHYNRQFETFNLEFLHDDYMPDFLNFRGFALPSSISPDYHIFNPYEDSTIKTLSMLSRKFKNRVKTESSTTIELSTFIEYLVKTFKIKLYQINVNSNFDSSGLKPYNVNCIVETVEAVKRFNMPTIIN